RRTSPRREDTNLKKNLQRRAHDRLDDSASQRSDEDGEGAAENRRGMTAGLPAKSVGRGKDVVPGQHVVRDTRPPSRTKPETSITHSRADEQSSSRSSSSSDGRDSTSYRRKKKRPKGTSGTSTAKCSTDHRDNQVEQESHEKVESKPPKPSPLRTVLAEQQDVTAKFGAGSSSSSSSSDEAGPDSSSSSSHNSQNAHDVDTSSASDNSSDESPAGSSKSSTSTFGTCSSAEDSRALQPRTRIFGGHHQHRREKEGTQKGQKRNEVVHTLQTTSKGKRKKHKKKNKNRRGNQERGSSNSTSSSMCSGSKSGGRGEGRQRVRKRNYSNGKNRGEEVVDVVDSIADVKSKNNKEKVKSGKIHPPFPGSTSTINPDHTTKRRSGTCSEDILSTTAPRMSEQDLPEPTPTSVGASGSCTTG
ncbi:unnamed protein product, partial [Amoebophrya sp. A120]